MAGAPPPHRVRVPFSCQSNLLQEAIMVKKQQKQPVVLKPSKKIADSRRVRFGGGMAPASLRK
jgi:hypothetical protein